MKILVTGSAGFIGSLICRAFMKDGINVRGFDSRCSADELDSFECIVGDIRNKELLLKAVESVDAVVHLIAMHHDFGIVESEYFEINEEATNDLLNCCSKAGVKKFVFFSSVAVYGTQSEPTNENTPPKPDTPYGCSKLAAEKVVMQWQREDPTRQVVIIRPTVVFGPENYANMYNLINQIFKGKFIFVGNGNNIKSIAYVENLVEATKFLLYRINPGIDVYNYSDEPQMTTKAIVEKIFYYLEKPMPKITIPLWLAVGFGSIFDVLGKITGYNFPITGQRTKKFCTETHHKADKILKEGFQPSISLDEGYKRTIHWFLNHIKSKNK